MIRPHEVRDIWRSNFSYNNRPVWIQEVNNNIATVVFIDNFEEKVVDIEGLYE